MLRVVAVLENILLTVFFCRNVWYFLRVNRRIAKAVLNTLGCFRNSFTRLGIYKARNNWHFKIATVITSLNRLKASKMKKLVSQLLMRNKLRLLAKWLLLMDCKADFLNPLSLLNHAHFADERRLRRPTEMLIISSREENGSEAVKFFDVNKPDARTMERNS